MSYPTTAADPVLESGPGLRMKKMIEIGPNLSHAIGGMIFGVCFLTGVAVLWFLFRDK